VINQKIIRIILFSAIGIIISYETILSIYSNYVVKKNGVYILGYVTEVSESKNGQIYDYEYSFKGKIFKVTFSDVGHKFKKGSLILIGIDQNHPKIFNAFYDTKVPECLTLSKVPDDGWKKLPLDSCK
jgi:hypothetical protein